MAQAYQPRNRQAVTVPMTAKADVGPLSKIAHDYDVVSTRIDQYGSL